MKGLNLTTLFTVMLLCILIKINNGSKSAFHSAVVHSEAIDRHTFISFNSNVFPSRTLNKQSDVGESSFALSPLVGEINSSSPLFEHLVRIETIKSTDLNKLLPPCNETTSLTSFYGSPKHLDLDAVELHCDSLGTGLNLSTTSPNSSATILLPESGLTRGASPGRVHQKSGTPRSLASRLLEVSGAGSVLRWRNRSGELTRPISIACPPGTCTDVADVSIFIEGGSYQDSSLGGSLSSLIGRGGDDVASCIAEAIQVMCRRTTALIRCNVFVVCDI
ncbi:hypothetical protein AHF37_07514 [Paragonimus kellicotti]|nr:hypothetical protein AHF37_07514 [Paragonimus kellicotti]